MEKGLVCFQGKSELPGKPMQYGTTRKFLEIFGLRNLRELPSLDEIDQLLPDGIGDEEDDEKLSDVTQNMSEDYQGNYSESEEELMKIEETLGDIDTSSEFFEQEKIRQKEKRDRDRAQDIREALDVGENVEEKEIRWLARYEEQLAAAAAEAEALAQAAADSEALDENSQEDSEFELAERAMESEAHQDYEDDESVILAESNVEAEITNATLWVEAAADDDDGELFTEDSDEPQRDGEL